LDITHFVKEAANEQDAMLMTRAHHLALQRIAEDTPLDSDVRFLIEQAPDSFIKTLTEAYTKFTCFHCISNTPNCDLENLSESEPAFTCTLSDIFNPKEPRPLVEFQGFKFALVVLNEMYSRSLPAAVYVCESVPFQPYHRRLPFHAVCLVSLTDHCTV
jgi:hypothetical protein